MKVHTRFFWLGLLLGAACCLSGACGGIAAPQQYRISEIHSPAELPGDLKQFHFHLLKRGEFGSQVAILDLDFQEQRFYHTPEYLSRVDLSPDGTQLVYGRMTSLGDIKPIWLYIVDLASGDELKIAGWGENYDQMAISNPSFTADGEGVLFTVTRYDSGIIGLARVQRDGTDLEILDTDLPLNEGPEASPDNSLILATCAGADLMSDAPGFQLCLLDDRGRFLEAVTQSGSVPGSYAFTPDGNQLVYTEYEIGGVIGFLNRPRNFLIVHDLQSGAQHQLLDWEVEVLGISPDGREIIFMGKRDRRAAWAIYLLQIDGSDLRHLVYWDDFLEAWYADAAQ